MKPSLFPVQFNYKEEIDLTVLTLLIRIQKELHQKQLICSTICIIVHLFKITKPLHKQTPTWNPTIKKLLTFRDYDINQRGSLTISSLPHPIKQVNRLSSYSIIMSKLLCSMNLEHQTDAQFPNNVVV